MVLGFWYYLNINIEQSEYASREWGGVPTLFFTFGSSDWSQFRSHNDVWGELVFLLADAAGSGRAWRPR
jgi:hypothetical protein